MINDEHLIELIKLNYLFDMKLEEKASERLSIILPFIKKLGDLRCSNIEKKNNH